MSPPKRSERENFRRRLLYERDKRGWTRAELSRRLTFEGCVLGEQQIYNLETPPPGRAPRDVKVDELVAFAQAFDLPVVELLRSPEVVLADHVAAALSKADTHARALVDAYKGLDEALRGLLLLLPGSPSTWAVLDRAARIEGTVLELIEFSRGVGEDLRTGKLKPLTPRKEAGRTTGRGRRGEHQQAR